LKRKMGICWTLMPTQKTRKKISLIFQIMQMWSQVEHQS